MLITKYGGEPVFFFLLWLVISKPVHEGIPGPSDLQSDVD